MFVRPVLMLVSILFGVDKVFHLIEDVEGEQKLRNYAAKNGDFVIVPERVYRTDLRQEVAEGDFPATEEERRTERHQAEEDASELLRHVPRERVVEMQRQLRSKSKRSAA